MPKGKKLLVIDGNAIVHRAYHALPPLQTKTGEIVNAVYGFCLMFLKALNEIKPNFVVACFDVKGPTFRHIQFKDYKAKRKKAPDELYSQIGLVKDVLQAFSVPIFEQQGYEADDLIATICFLMQKKQISPKPEIVILSGDMDNLQLVSATVKVYTMRKGLKDVVLYGVKEVQERYDGLLPSQVVDYKALRGDLSDNIPGITGIGEKTAIQILKDFGSLENLYKEVEANTKKAQTLKPGLLQKIKDYKDQAHISQKLAQMDSKAPVDFNLKEIEFGGYDKEKIKAMLQNLEFFSLIDKFLGVETKNKKDKKIQNNQEGLFGTLQKANEDIEQDIENLKERGVLSSELAKLELSLIPVVKKMEQNGILIDFKKLKELSLDFEKEIEKLQKQIFKISKSEFNLNSPSQLSEILFSKLGISVIGVKKTPGGAISTNAEELKKIANEHPIINLIIEYREIFKLKTGFVDALPRMISPKDGRIHSQFHQLGTATGRISCLPVGTLINTKQGLVGIETVRVGESIRTSCGLRKVSDWQATGKKPVVVLEFSNGITLRCSPEHRLRSKNEWAKAVDVKVGMPVYMSFTGGIFGDQVVFNLNYTSKYRTKKTPILPKAWTEDLAGLIGYILADGHICRSNYNGKPSKVVLAFGWNDEYLISHFKRAIKRVFGKSGVRRITKTCLTLEVSGVDIGGCVEQLGAGGLSGNIRVPPGLFCAPENIVAAFLRGYFEGDGYVRDDQIGVRSVSLNMLEDVQQLLTLFGIPSSISRGSTDPRGYARRYTLRIVGDRSKQSFYNRIGFLSARKQGACKKSVMASNEKSPAELLTLPNDLNLESIKPQLYSVHRDIKQRIPQALSVFMHKFVAGCQTITLQRAEWIISSLLNEELRQRISFLDEAVKGQYYEVTVIKVSHESAVPMYDISIDEGEQYIAQGIIVHNSSNPNLQNIPVKTDLGKKIRECFIPESGFIFLSADYSQMDFRVAASLSHDKIMLGFLRQGKDIHLMTASLIFKLKESDVSEKQRYLAKTLNYGVLYGLGPYGFASRTGIDFKSAKDFIAQYFETFQGIAVFVKETIEEAKKLGFSQTMFGRKRFLPELHSRDPRIRSQAERIARNFPIQGTSADIMKMAMAKIASKKILNKNCRLLLQLHDELLFEIKKEEVEKPGKIIKEAMEQAAKIEVPLKVEIKTGLTWGEV